MPTRPTRWLDTIVGNTIVNAGQAVVSLLAGIGPVDTRGVTVIRTIIRLDIVSTSVAGAWGSQSVDLAMGIASQEAFAAAVVPDPVVAADEPARGWMWRDRILATQNGINTEITKRLVADIHGARKIQDGEVYLVMDNNAHLGTSFSINVTGLVRLLLKLG